MTMSHNPNLSGVRLAARKLGASIVDIREGGKHTLVTLRTRGNVQVRIALSRYRIDDYVLQGWVRQAINQAMQVFVDRVVGSRANDNEEIPSKEG